jgi:hypothetical protein
VKKVRHKRRLTIEDMRDSKIRKAFLEAYNERVIDAGYLSKNKSIKTNCLTTRPQRGQVRYFTNNHIVMSVVDPYNDSYYDLLCSIHRVAAFLFVGEFAPGQHALHHCDIRMCCNPAHIYIGTEKDNRNDYRNRRTEKRANGHLTRYEWESIKYWLDQGHHSVEELSKYFECNRRTIDNGPPKFTTDGSEVIGDVFIPKMIPESLRVKRVRKAIEYGKEYLEITDFCKKVGWKVSWELEEEAINRAVTISRIHTERFLAKINPHPDNYKYGITKLIDMSRRGIDVTIPIK